MLGIALAATGATGQVRPAPAGGQGASRALLVRTDNGVVRGAAGDGVENFLGLPYAAPPVGKLRFAPPRPARPWSGVRDAARFGSACAQTPNTTEAVSETEDCLFINVQRPAGTTPGQRLPVLVFVHDGGFTQGAGSNYDMNAVVRADGIIGVTLNHRLGVFGGLGLPGLTRDQGESGNEELQDQQAALRWVQRNIAVFGGDPKAVTFYGISAGSISGCGHLVSPGSRGLFGRAILGSGLCHTVTRAQSEARGTSFAKAAGCTDEATAVACLRALPATRILSVGKAQGFGGPMFVRGTPTLPDDPREAVRTGAFMRVPIVIGDARDEMRAFIIRKNFGWTRGQYETWVKTSFGDTGPAVLAHYPWPANADTLTAAYLIAAIFDDAGLLYHGGGFSGCDLRRRVDDFARYTETYAYKWLPDADSPGLAFSQTPGVAEGAGHGSEIAYIWPGWKTDGVRLASKFSPADRALSDQVIRHWGAFAVKGRPDAGGQPDWPRYVPASRSWLSLRTGGKSVVLNGDAFAAQHRCGFWDTIGELPAVPFPSAAP
jgi:para-nitrobenzyl esterase